MTADSRYTHYRVLMLHESVGAEILSVVYRKLAQRYHPDVDPSPEAAERMREINVAYEVLHDPARRARYEAGLPPGPPSGTVIDFGRYRAAGRWDRSAAATLTTSSG